MPEIQTTFTDVQEIKKVKALTQNQRKIITLIGAGLTQTSIADKLQFSPSYINQVIKRLETLGLIKRVKTQTNDSARQYNHFYEISPELKVPGRDFNICHVHRIRMKFKILSQSGPACISDKRTGYSRSWNMRGGARHKFWYAGKAGIPSITVDVHPKTLVIYMDKGQMIPAKTMDQAEEIAWYAVYQARDRFVELQDKYGVKFEIENEGNRIDKVEYGFLYHKDSGVGEAVKPLPPNWWDDASVEQEFPGHREFETDVKEEAQQVHSAITQLQHMPEIMQQFEKNFGEINQNVLSVMAQLQGGKPVESMFLQAVGLISQMTGKMNKMEEELEQLKKSKNGTRTGPSITKNRRDI